MKTYTTLAGEASASYVDRKSEFIAYAAPVTTEEEAAEFIRKIKKKHSDARHNVYAYILRGGAIKRYSDDGEPQGSAGMPVLDILEKNGIDGAVIVVTRYFGGILLGTGGLVRAYSGTAAKAVSGAGIVTLEECAVLEVRLSYNDHARLAGEFARYGAVIEESEFGADVLLKINIREALRADFEARLTEGSAGRAAVRFAGTKMALL